MRPGPVLVALATASAGCSGSGNIPAPSTASRQAVPSVAAPALAIPSDLDVVVRIDLDPIRAAVPGGIDSSLTAPVFGPSAGSSSSVVRRALGRARQVWIGWRPGSRPEHWDNVVVLRGDFSGVGEDMLARAFHPPRDIGAGWRTYDVRQVGGRAAPARLYAHLEDLWVVASAAEIDAVDRVLEGRAVEEGLEAPEQGVVSLAARMPSVAAGLRRRAPKAARFLAKAREARASADLTSEGLDVSAEMQFDGDQEAERAAAALRLLLRALALQGPSWVDDVRVSSTAATVALRARVPHRVLAALSTG